MSVELDPFEEAQLDKSNPIELTEELVNQMADRILKRTNRYPEYARCGPGTYASLAQSLMYKERNGWNGIRYDKMIINDKLLVIFDPWYPEGILVFWPSWDT